MSGILSPSLAGPSQLCRNCSLLEDLDRLSVPTASPSILRYYLNTSFSVQDTWPELPQLTASAASGCHFCAVLHKSLKGARDVQTWRSGEGTNVDIAFCVVPDVYQSTVKRGAVWVGDASPDRRLVFGFVARLVEPSLGLIREAKFLACVDVRVFSSV